MGTTYVPAGASSQPASYNPTAGLDPMAPYDPYQAPYQAASPVAPYQAASPVAPAFGHSPVPASQPQGMSGIPLGAAVASAWPASNAPLSPGFGSPASGAPASGSAVGVAKPSAAKTARGRANQGRHVPLVFTIAVLMIAVTGGVLFVTLGNPNRDGANAERQVVQASPTGASSRYSTRNASRPTAPPPAERTSPNSVSIAAEPDENDTAWGPASDGEGMQPPRMSRTEAPMPVEAMSRPDIETPIETMPAPVMTEATTPSPDATPAPQPTAMETEPATSPEPAVPTVPEPDSPPTPTPTPEPAMIAMSSPEQVQALAQSLTTARLALGEMNFDLADAELAKAKPLATLPAHQAKLERLEQLAHYVKEFRAALVEAIKGFESGQGIQITQSTSIGIVEPNPNLLVIRVAGVNRRYTLNELPLGLAVALADEWLDQVAASSKLAKGAYVIVHKKASVDNIAKARGWWEEAGASDPDLVRDLMPVIDDRYDDLAADLK